MKSYKLNEQQSKAVSFPSGHLLVIAGPGSGKTQVISARCLYLIEQLGVLPDTILVITFTRDAAVNMQHRFFINSDSKYFVNFGTFHSIFFHMLQQSGEYSNKKLLNDSNKRKLVIKAIFLIVSKASDFDAKKDIAEKAAGVLEAISIYKNTLSLDKATNRIDKGLKKYFMDIFNEYESNRANSNGFDFDDMVYDFYLLLKKNKEILVFWRDRFEHILIDEYQDINPIQYEVIKLLATEAKIFAVGDDDQAIYAFRGSSRECVKRFVYDYKANIVNLNINYRSEQKIVEASSKVIEEDKDRFEKHLVSYKGMMEDEKMSHNTSSPVNLKGFKDDDEQIKYICNILKHITDGSQAESVALLFRTNTSMQKCAKQLLKNGIRYKLKNNKSCIYDSNVCKDILSYLKVINNCFEVEDFIRIINKPNRYLGREALLEACKKGTIGKERFDAKEAVSYLKYMLEYYREEKYISYSKERINSIEALICDIEFARKYNIYLQIDYVINKIGLKQYYENVYEMNSTQLSEIKEELDFFKADVENMDSLNDWLVSQSEFRSALKNCNNGNISLMTIHGSKGLEFDTVIIPNVNEGKYPLGRVLSKDILEEERRIFYVGMTRARSKLFLTYIEGTKESPFVPSRFINNMIN